MARRAPRVVERVAVARGLVALEGHAVQRRAPDALGVGAAGVGGPSIANGVGVDGSATQRGLYDA